MASLQAVTQFSELPNRPGKPPFSAWGLWGQSSDLGALDWLTQDEVSSTVKELVTGERVSLNLPLDLLHPPLLGRTQFKQQVVDKSQLIANDDVVSLGQGHDINYGKGSLVFQPSPSE